MEINEKLIEDVVRRILKDTLNPSNNYKTIDKSGIIAIDTKKVKTEKFPFSIPTDKVTLRDVLTLEESPRMGLGVMEIDNDQLEWTLKYDEVDYIIEGTLEIIVDGRSIVANEGQMIYIPKNSKIIFKSPNKSRFIYVVYPADWADL
ncbi:MAG: ethanolamine utilization protein EutQ [Lachnospirales bacterium]